VHPTDPSRSLIIGTVKVAAPAGAVVAYGLDGQIRQMIPGIDRPNNIDVEYGIWEASLSISPSRPNGSRDSCGSSVLTAVTAA
jgi:myo-inositol-hexaphosphate 3-phosphohydrolase